MKHASTVKMEKLCLELQDNRKATIECLQRMIDDKAMQRKGQKEVVVDEVESAKDYQ
jgi:hypothetical protein